MNAINVEMTTCLGMGNWDRTEPNQIRKQMTGSCFGSLSYILRQTDKLFDQ